MNIIVSAVSLLKTMKTAYFCNVWLSLVLIERTIHNSMCSNVTAFHPLRTVLRNNIVCKVNVVIAKAIYR